METQLGVDAAQQVDAVRSDLSVQDIAVSAPRKQPLPRRSGGWLGDRKSNWLRRQGNRI